MKKLALFLSVLLVLTFVGCASGQGAKETDAFRFDQKGGYACTFSPFGSSTAELESAAGTKLRVQSESPSAAPFAYTTYVTENTVKLADCTGKLEAQFDANGKLFSLSFYDAASDEDGTHFKQTSERFTKTFGEPVEQTDNGLGTQYLEWQDKKSGTALSLSYSDLGADTPTLTVTVFEKSRYTENGIGSWAEA